MYQFSGESGIPTLYYGGLDEAVADRLLFGSFGTYEIMIVTNFVLYLISGPLLHLMFGVKKVKDERVLGLIEEVKQKYINQVPLKRGCTYEDVANVMVFIVSDDASYITGQAINVTGGQEMR